MPNSTPDPLDPILELLAAGDFTKAIPALQQLARQEPPRADVFYNLGIALSHTEQFPEAVIALKRCTGLEADFRPAYVGLGVAYGRLRKFPEARDALAEALRLKPEDPLTMQNMAGVLLMLGENEQSVEMARRGHRLKHQDERILWILAQALHAWASDPACPDQVDIRSEASRAFKLYLERHPTSPMAETAEKALTKIAHATLRERGIGQDGLRLDVLEYIIAALKMLDGMSPDQRNRVVLEIAKVGAEGLNINSPDRRHAIKGLPGDYTGLQLVSIMYTAMQQIDPTVDTGSDFSREYKAARSVHGGLKSG